MHGGRYPRGHALYADMAELADAPDLGSGVLDVQVQVLLSALNGANLNQSDGLGFAPFCALGGAKLNPICGLGFALSCAVRVL